MILASSSPDLRLHFENALSGGSGLACGEIHLHVATDGRPPEPVQGSAAGSATLIVLDPTGYALPAAELIRRWHEANPDTPILLMAETGDAEQAKTWLQAGMRGLLPTRPTQTPVETLRKAIVALTGGELWLQRGLMAKLLTGMLETPATPRKPASRTGFKLLTTREAEIVDAAIAGLSNREIAVRFAIGESTVKTHLHHAFEKLNLVRRSQLLNRRPASGR